VMTNEPIEAATVTASASASTTPPAKSPKRALPAAPKPQRGTARPSGARARTMLAAQVPRARGF
jgi:hypothetical protein